MSTYRRLYIPGGTYFFTVVTYKRKPILCTSKHIERLKSSFHYAQQKKRFTINGLVILPDHFHCLLTFDGSDNNFSKTISLIKRYFSVGIPSAIRKNHEKTIWQRRFWEHAIRNDKDYERHLDYIYYNPVKHGHAKNPYDWPYSTFKRDVRSGLYPQNWAAREEPGRITGLNFE